MIEKSEKDAVLLLDTETAPIPKSIKLNIIDSGLPVCTVESLDHLISIARALNPGLIFACQGNQPESLFERVIGQASLVQSFASVNEAMVHTDANSAALCKVILFDSITNTYFVYYSALFSALGKSKRTNLSLSESDLSISDGYNSIKFTRAEFTILKYLVENEGQVTSKETLAEVALGRPAHPQDRSVDVHICRIRKKASPVLCKNTISSVRGGGYFFQSAV